MAGGPTEQELEVMIDKFEREFNLLTNNFNLKQLQIIRSIVSKTLKVYDSLPPNACIRNKLVKIFYKI